MLPPALYDVALHSRQARSICVGRCHDDTPRCRVFITGISGMIGSHLARELVTSWPCVQVFGLVRPRTDLSALHGVLHEMTLLKGDITDASRMREVLRSTRPHTVYHLAAQAINGISYDLAQLTLDANVRGTLNVLEAVRLLRDTSPDLQTRVLLAGSSTEYGRTADNYGVPIPEEAPLRPVTPYGVSKVATENLGTMYNTSYGVPVITARFFIQVGVGGTDSLAVHEFCKQIALAEMGLAPPELSHGNLNTSRDMTDARDAAPVVVALSEIGEPGEAYNIGTGRTMTVHELLRLAVSKSTVRIKTRQDFSRFRFFDEKILVADISKVRALTGWQPSSDMDDTVGRILDYWRRKVALLYGDGSAVRPPRIVRKESNASIKLPEKSGWKLRSRTELRAGGAGHSGEQLGQQPDEPSLMEQREGSDSVQSRVAVCITGQPRGAGSNRISSTIGRWPASMGDLFASLPKYTQQQFMHFVARERPTVLDTVHEYLYPSLGTPFDVFMVVSSTNRTAAEAQCAAYTPRIRDSRLVCQMSPNHVPTRRELNMTADQLHSLRVSYTYGGSFSGFLAQLWDYHRCDHLIRNQESLGINYSTILRVRADSAFFGPVNATEVPSDECQVFMRSREIRGGGNEDILQIGSAKVMHGFLSRVLDFPVIFGWRGWNRWGVAKVNGENGWYAETYARAWVAHECGHGLTERPGLPFHPWRFSQCLHGQPELPQKHPLPANMIVSSLPSLPAAKDDESDVAQPRSCDDECSGPSRWVVAQPCAGATSGATCVGASAGATVRCCGVEAPSKPKCISVCDAPFDHKVASSEWSKADHTPLLLEFSENNFMAGKHAAWPSARDECAARGLRLCSKRELEEGTCCRTGCGFDPIAAWSNSDCSRAQCLQSCRKETAGWREAYRTVPSCRE